MPSIFPEAASGAAATRALVFFLDVGEDLAIAVAAAARDVVHTDCDAVNGVAVSGVAVSACAAASMDSTINIARDMASDLARPEPPSRGHSRFRYTKHEKTRSTALCSAGLSAAPLSGLQPDE